MDEDRLVVEVEKYPELIDPQSRHCKDQKHIAWRVIALEIGFSGEKLSLISGCFQMILS